MKNAFGLFIGVAAVLILMSCGSQKPSYPELGPPWPERVKPTWMDKGLVFVGRWEPLQWAYRKNWQNWENGHAGSLAEEIHYEEHTEETILGLKKMGVNMVLTSFHKGFGIQNEKFNMDEAAELGKLLNKHDMLMGTYVSALLLYEDLYAEFPEARNWHRVNYDGSPNTYPNMTMADGYRYRAFLNHPEYLNYMKRVCELAIEAGTDLIHFDTVSQPGENHHPLALQMFRDWLKAKYPAQDEWFFRTGLLHRAYVLIPHYPSPGSYATFDNPLMQEYIHFKCELLGNYAAEMCTFIHNLNPEVAIEFNPHGVSGHNNYLQRNIDHERILPYLDAYWSEEGNHAEFTDDGRLIGKIRSMKLGQMYNSVMFSYTGTRMGEDPRLLLAESMAYNRQCLGDLGTPLNYKDYPQRGRKYVKFFWENFDLYEKTETAADVAVLRSFASMAFNNYGSQREVMLAEQTLLQRQIPFDIIFDEHLHDLSKYKVVILANQEALSDEQIALIADYVTNGGGIVATANTAMWNEWRRYRRTCGLQHVLGIEKSVQKGGTIASTRQEVGEGRTAYIGELMPKIPVPARTWFHKKYWAPPQNAAELIDAIEYTAGKSLDFDINAPEYVAIEAYAQPEQNRYIVHIVNFDAADREQVNAISIILNTEDASAVKKVTAYSPDTGAPVNLRITRTSTGIRVLLPKLEVYTVLAFQK